ncbi:MAG: right-handed parallel beta-helix repeat-containing protein, partial [Psychrobacter sp.]
KIRKFAYDNTNEDIQAVNKQIASLGENGVALMSGVVTFDDSLIIGESQTLLGNGSLLIKTPSGKQAQYRQNTPAKINNTSGDSSVIKVASNSTVTGITTKGGAEGIGSLNEISNNIRINNVNISATTGDGIKLNNTNGLNIRNSKIHDLNICANNTNCEFAVFSPTNAPNSAVSAIGSQNINIDNVDIDNVTYGIFLASDYDQETSTYRTTTSNVNINNTSISNSRREGLLLVGNDNVTINDLTIDNSNQDQEMDLVVLQGSHDVTMNETNLSGGINGLMIVNSYNLPSFDDNNIKIKNMNISNTSRSGVFINPASKIELENVTVNNPGVAGIALYGNEWMGGAVEDVTITNLQINNPAENAVVLFGPVKNIRGDINTDQNENACSNLWDMAKFEQGAESTLTINGNKIASLKDCS